jgi:hypothetical protein
MILPLLTALVLSPPPDPPVREAELRVTTQAGGELLLSIENDEGRSRRTFTVQCVAKCVRPLHYVREIADDPLGLFRRWDGDNLIYSTWVGGVSYTVRVWSVGDHGVRLLFEHWSRGMPDFMTDDSDRQIIRTYERPTDAAGREKSIDAQPVLWRFENGSFVRLKRRGR